MRVTPLDIIKKEFAPARRNGIDKEEVDSFLSDVRDTLDELIKENQRLRDMIARRDAEIAQLRGEESSIKDTLILVEHVPVYTLGKNADSNHLLQSRDKSIDVYNIERGGDITFHGPGLLVGYPILDLSNYKKKSFFNFLL